MHDLATQHILDLEERNKELKARIAKKEAEIHKLNRQRYLKTRGWRDGDAEHRDEFREVVVVTL